MKTNRGDDNGSHQTWNTCPDCFREWKDATATPGVIHRTRLCPACAGRREQDSKDGVKR